ncbi:MAG: dTDP-glucose 4,6-dehydratase, dTDP-glucose 4,6-dehydratase, partial [Candidatus Levybacteria bacterium]|nr:dTDP-glucose 4,6-dehydratase, dTDP-glucose 4,6-dehydratase [Candidatus Levybacteria bacterium]
MKLLVTGGAGFIGSNFIPYWMKNYPNDQIVNLDSLTYAGNLENLKDVEKNPNYKFINGNICDLNIVDQAMQNVDMVVHFAAESH